MQPSDILPGSRRESDIRQSERPTTSQKFLSEVVESTTEFYPSVSPFRYNDESRSRMTAKDVEEAMILFRQTHRTLPNKTQLSTLDFPETTISSSAPSDKNPKGWADLKEANQTRKIDEPSVLDAYRKLVRIFGDFFRECERCSGYEGRVLIFIDSPRIEKLEEDGTTKTLIAPGWLFIIRGQKEGEVDTSYFPGRVSTLALPKLNEYWDETSVTGRKYESVDFRATREAGSREGVEDSEEIFVSLHTPKLFETIPGGYDTLRQTLSDLLGGDDEENPAPVTETLKVLASLGNPAMLDRMQPGDIERFLWNALQRGPVSSTKEFSSAYLSEWKTHDLETRVLPKLFELMFPEGASSRRTETFFIESPPSSQKSYTSGGKTALYPGWILMIRIHPESEDRLGTSRVDLLADQAGFARCAKVETYSMCISGDQKTILKGNFYSLSDTRIFPHADSGVVVKIIPAESKK